MHEKKVEHNHTNMKYEQSLTSDEENGEEDNDDDLITLNGCGQITQWRFPKGMERCPLISCQELFDDRSEAIDHYKVQHAKKSILCYVCDIPIYTYSSKDFEAHFRRMHPDAEIPFQFNGRIKQEIQPNKNMDEVNEADDPITLSGCGQVTYWRFPTNMTRCPLLSCQETCPTRSATMNHFKIFHAKNAILCHLCDKPIFTYSFEGFNEHFRRFHATEPLPFPSKETVDEEVPQTEKTDPVPRDDNLENVANEEDDLITLRGCGQTTYWRFPQDSKQCPVKRCEEKFDSRLDAIAHYKLNHAMKAILCTLCDRPIAVNQPGTYEKHYLRLHPFKRMPFNFHGRDSCASKQLPSQIDEVNVPLDSRETDDEVDDLITLEGCGQISQWRFPRDVSRCPVRNCTETFEFRSVGIAHYKEQHAKNAIFCLICQRPVLTKSLSFFINHYREKHPGEELTAYNFDEKRSDQSSQNENGQDEKNDDDDLVTLKGCGQITQWRFPQETTSCPMLSCHKDYGIRSLAISHFKYRHAKHSAFCSECERPVGAKTVSSLILHYSKLHPNAELPSYLKKPELETVESESEIDDLITLRGGGQITQWRFPKIKCCPIRRCPAQFESRTRAISHYKKHHAKHYIYCSICDKPIQVQNFQCFARHYDRNHLGIEVPIHRRLSDDNEEEDLITLRGGGVVTHWRFPPDLRECPIRQCNMEFDNRSDAIAHYKVWHAPSNLFCSVCDRPIPTYNLKNYKEHFQNVHPNNQEIPQLVGEETIQTEDEDSECDSSDDDDGNEEVDDLITLRGCGLITQWKFPENLKNCPVIRCKNSFRSRSKAIIHYKQKHADIAILCPPCKKPVSANSKNSFIVHHRRWHSYRKMPYNFEDENMDGSEELPSPTEKITDGVDEDNKAVNDLIKLEGFEQITYWRFPENMTSCPIKGCKRAFQYRSSAIEHYQKIHATDSILCTICDKPVASLYISFFVKHFREKHPDVELPDNIREKLKEETLQNDSVNMDDAYDLIKLTGCDLITYWPFPKDITKCPSYHCKTEFGDRYLAIAHYKRQHAKKSVFCSVCERPISASHISSFMQHCEKVHPNEKPLCLNEEIVENVTDVDDGVDDLIILGGGDQITQWHFPKGTKRCPVYNCRAEFKTRSNAISHYRNFHTQSSIFCSICDKPVGAVDFNAFIRHYKKYHPDVEVPSKGDEEDDLIILKGGFEISQWRFPQSLTTCPVKSCLKEFNARSELIAHYRNRHAMNFQYCSICDKPVGAHCLTTYRQHYRKFHPNMKNKKPNLFDKEKNDSDEGDDWITLTGGGQITHWQFPKKATNCPVKSCLEHFGVRSDAIDHYKKRHAMNYIFCSECDKPVSMYFLIDINEHYRRVHPNVALPKDDEESVDQSEMESSQVENVDSNVLNESNSDESDLIELTGGGQITQWRFPKNIRHCPVTKCDAKFRIRSDAIAHYKQRHAKNSIYCTICQRPIRSDRLYLFRKHYMSLHPEVPFPFSAECHSEGQSSQAEMIKPTLRSSNKSEETDDMDDLILLGGCGQITQWQFPEELAQCPVEKCGIPFTVRSDAIIHYKNHHANKSIYCSICDWPIYAERSKDFKEHYYTKHPDVDFELNFGEIPPEAHEMSMFQEDHDDEDDVITLNGCGRISHWKFPADLTNCPVFKCNAEFGLRSDAIDHYKKCHAMNAIYCSMCEKPIAAYTLSNLKAHYTRMHPGIDFILNFKDEPSTSKDLSPKKNDVKPKMQNDTVKKESGEDGDLITLRGCGLTTHWRFPTNVTDCPVQKCPRKFKHRLDAIAHYKADHAENAIYCSICKKPISVGCPKHFKLHYNRMHPDIKVPFEIDDENAGTSKRKESLLNEVDKNDSDSEDMNNVDQVDDDLITLGGCGQVTQWRFPQNLSSCPVLKCLKEFNSRSDAITHYKLKHAKNAVYCSLCNKPIAAPLPGIYKLHYNRLHPNIKNPFDEITENKRTSDLVTLSGCGQITQWRFPKTKRCPVLKCSSSFETRLAAMNHYKKKHARNAIFCHLCNKPIGTSTFKALTLHFRKRHPGKRIPFKFHKNRPDGRPTRTKEVKPIPQSGTTQNVDDELITLEALGVITQWKFPPNMTVCPVLKCRKKFEDRKSAIDHYKSEHTQNSFYCSMCDKPLRIHMKIDLEKHYQCRHPNMKIPLDFGRGQFAQEVKAKASNRNGDKDTDDRESDLITIEGVGKIEKWRFPPHLNACPIQKCPSSIKNRSAAIAHFKNVHAKRATLCPMCKKLILNWNNNLEKHIKRMHPNAKDNGNKLSLRGKEETKPPIKYKLQAKNCNVCGKSVTNLDRHMLEKHTAKRIVCPLKECTFTTKRIDRLRHHWNRSHGNLRFPEIRNQSGFTYKTNASSDEEQEEPNKCSTSDSSSDTEPNYQPKQSKRRRIDSTDGEEDRFEDMISHGETSSDDESSEFQVRKKKPRAFKRRRISSSSSSSNGDLSDAEDKNDAKKQKLADTSLDSEGSKIIPTESTELSPRAKMLAKKMPPCSVVLDIPKRVNALRQEVEDEETVEELDSSGPSTNNDPDSEPEIEQEFVEGLDSDIQMSIGTFEPVTEPIGEIAYRELAVDPEPPETLMAPIPLIEIIEVHPNNEFKKEEIIEKKPTIFHTPEIIYISDSDDEEEFAKPTNSNNINAPTQGQDPNSLHIRRMSVLMMAKKEPI